MSVHFRSLAQPAQKSDAAHRGAIRLRAIPAADVERSIWIVACRPARSHPTRPRSRHRAARIPQESCTFVLKSPCPQKILPMRIRSEELNVTNSRKRRSADLSTNPSRNATRSASTTIAKKGNLGTNERNNPGLGHRRRARATPGSSLAAGRFSGRTPVAP